MGVVDGVEAYRVAECEKASKEWFLSQVWMRRLGYAVLYGVVLFGITFIGSIVLLQCDLNPFNWAHAGVECCVSWKMILLLFLSSFLFAATSAITSKTLTVFFRNFAQNVSVMPFLWDIGFNFASLVVSLITTFYILEASNSRFRYQIESESSSEKAYVGVGHCLILFAMLLKNAWSSFEYFSRKHYLFQFSEIVRFPLYAFKCDWKIAMRAAVHRSVQTVVVSSVLLPVFGLRLISIMAAPSAEAPSFCGIVWNLLDLRLMWTVFVLLVREEFVRTFQRNFAHCFMNQPIEFPIPPPRFQAALADNQLEIPYLTVAMESKLPLLKYYAFRDFNNLCQKSSVRRAQIFAVSQPGGHPRNWNSVLGNCLVELKCLLAEIRKQNGRLCGSIDVGAYQLSKPQREMMLQPKRMRLFERSGFRDRSQDFRGEISCMTGGSKQSYLRMNVYAWLKWLVGQELSAQGSGVSMEKAFRDSQLYIWAIQGLSHLIYYSYDEDRLGIVQKDLSGAFGMILNLQNSVERFSRLSGLHRQYFHSGKENENLETAALVGLRQALESAVYRVCDRFSQHLEDIGLTEEQRSWLNSRCL